MASVKVLVMALLGLSAIVDLSSGLRPLKPANSQRIYEVRGEPFPERRRERRSTSAQLKASLTNTEDLVKVSDLSSTFRLNNSHLHLMVHWAGQGSNVMFCLARDQEMKPGATSRVFYSLDYGTSFSDISQRFTLDDGISEATIAKFYHHPESNCHYVFADTVNKYVFTSTDCGKTISGHKLEMTPALVEFDKSVDKTFLVHDLVDEEKKLFVTRNFGETFSHVQDYVKGFFFQEPESGEGASTLYIERMEPPGDRSTILSSTNYFERQVDTTIVFVGAKEFELRGGYMFVTKPSGSNPKHLDLFISKAGARFVPAKFGGTVDDDSGNVVNLDYHIIDVTEDGEVLVAVNHNGSLSNLYTSAKITPYEVEFSISLERVMYYNPRVTWHDSWLADTAGDEPFVDVYRVQGLRGIYIASQISESSMNHDQIQPDDLVSLITFDQGAQWSPIMGPDTDEEGYKFPNCENESCSLHVSQQLSKRFPSTRSIPILSSPSAIGIVMATGNMGRNLSHRSDVFLSADAGLSWHQVLKGSYYFNLGDHGGVIVAVKYFKTEGWTNELHYSTNEGVTWKKLTFYKEPLRVFGLLTEPGENTTIFTMFGTAKNPAGGSGIDWIIIKVDLKTVFANECTEDDYKKWSPADHSVGKHRNCILGRKEVYERRTIHSNCYNGLNYERRVTVQNCGCDRSDFQCDFGFMRDRKWTADCVKDPRYQHDAYAVPTDCPAGSFYNRTRGYIKIRGDTCVEGKASRFEPAQVPCPMKKEKEFLLVSQRKSIVRVNLRDTSEVETLPLKNVNNVITLEYDMEDDCVMYGDIEVDKIFIQCLNGSEPRILVESKLNSVEGMAYDWISKTLYFVDGTRRMIELIRVDMENQGRMRKTILLVSRLI